MQLVYFFDIFWLPLSIFEQPRYRFVNFILLKYKNDIRSLSLCQDVSFWQKHFIKQFEPYGVIDLCSWGSKDITREKHPNMAGFCFFVDVKHHPAFWTSYFHDFLRT